MSFYEGYAWLSDHGPKVRVFHLYIFFFRLFICMYYVYKNQIYKKKDRKALVQSKTEIMPLVNFINSSVFFVLS